MGVTFRKRHNLRQSETHRFLSSEDGSVSKICPSPLKENCLLLVSVSNRQILLRVFSFYHTILLFAVTLSLHLEVQTHTVTTTTPSKVSSEETLTPPILGIVLFVRDPDCPTRPGTDTTRPLPHLDLRSLGRTHLSTEYSSWYYERTSGSGSLVCVSEKFCRTFCLESKCPYLSLITKLW